jgi:hypothetical protein
MRSTAALTVALTLFGCEGTLMGPRAEEPTIGPVGEAPSSAGGTSGTSPATTAPPPQPGDVASPAGPPVFLPAGIRRLSQAEAQLAAKLLLGVPTADFAAALGPDLRQSGFTRNADQRVGSVQADALWQATQALANVAVTQRLSTLAPCTTSGGSEACARTFISSFATKAFRRAVTPTEATGLLDVYRAGQAGSTYAAGIELIITAVLQSASFLYVTELGQGGSSTTRLTGEEVATSLALLFTGAPASDELMAQARSGALDTASGRELAARALLSTPAARVQVQRLLLEWEGADAVADAPKDPGLFPDWPAVRADVAAESRAIIDDVMFLGDGTLRSLLSTAKTTVTPALATFYGLGLSGQVDQPATRRGLLLAGGFSAANAHFDATAPVKRGATVRRKLLCQDLKLPTTPGLTIVVPAPDPTKTTRERFAAHSASPSCAGCHQLLDPIGFAMESFDAVGRFRTTENGHPIDPSGALVGAGDADGAFTDAAGMAALLANSKTVADCFQHQLFRFAAGRSGAEEERTFSDFVRARPSGQRGHVLELLVDYAQSESFVTRSVP